ncbi:CapA family protein [Candidatus Contubernalis alkaliaceticus]|uniref:CapA family protein n=1 Tax=Candidatus Contubernalis alkaliaceticus TaxID=338645 RepID=UPI001F4C2639|nr:CapA family protein [Candidatus Contubernalis alkalaceticus]UNC91713.1 CapA family protein [Candidatus Contubernalis alkalaceticus]
MKATKKKALAFMKASKKKGALIPLLSTAFLLLYLIYQVSGNSILPVFKEENLDNLVYLETLPGLENSLVISIGGNVNPLPVSRLPDNVEPPFFCPTVSETLSFSDLNIANLMAPIVEDDYEALDKANAWGDTPETAPLLKKAGIDLIQVSGHHILDYGAPGLINTLTMLKSQDITALGAGLNSEEAFTPYYYTKEGLTVGILAFNASPPLGWTAGTNRLGVTGGEEEMIKTILKEMEQKSQLSLVLVSFKDSHSSKASAEQKEFARQLVNMGTHIVVGTGANIVQETELYQGGIIFYNLGNFTAPPSMYSYQREGVLITLILTPQGENLIFALPLQVDRPVNSSCPIELRKKILDFKIFSRIKGETPWEQHQGYLKLLPGNL